MKLWDVATGKERFTLKGPTCANHSLAFSPDGKVLAVAGEDDRIGKTTASVVRLWDRATGKQRYRTAVRGDFPRALAFSPDSKLLASGDSDAIVLHDVAAGKEVRRLPGRSGLIL